MRGGSKAKKMALDSVGGGKEATEGEFAIVGGETMLPGFGG